MIHNVVDFRSVTARDLMLPLAAFPTVEEDAEIEQLIAASQGGSIERFLVSSGTGEIAGIVYLFEILLDRGPRTDIGPFIRRVVPVPLTESAPRLLRKLRAARSAVALVMDEKTPVGVVSRDAVHKRLLRIPKE